MLQAPICMYALFLSLKRLMKLDEASMSQSKVQVLGDVLTLDVNTSPIFAPFYCTCVISGLLIKHVFVCFSLSRQSRLDASTLRRRTSAGRRRRQQFLSLQY